MLITRNNMPYMAHDTPYMALNILIISLPTGTEDHLESAWLASGRIPSRAAQKHTSCLQPGETCTR